MRRGNLQDFGANVMYEISNDGKQTRRKYCVLHWKAPASIFITAKNHICFGRFRLTFSLTICSIFCIWNKVTSIKSVEIESFCKRGIRQLITISNFKLITISVRLWILLCKYRITKGILKRARCTVPISCKLMKLTNWMRVFYFLAR